MNKQIMFGLIEAILWISASSMAGMSLPGCPEKCGDVSIPYPFGIGSSCYLHPAYDIVCNSSMHPSKPFLSSFNLEVEQITLHNFDVTVEHNGIYEGKTKAVQTITVKTPVEMVCGINNASVNSVDLGGTPYMFSGDKNVLVVRGCGSNVILRNRSYDIQGGCSSLCDDSLQIVDKVLASCDVGIGCCRINVTDTDIYRLNVSNVFTSSYNCTRTMLVSKTYTSKLQHDHSSSLDLQLSYVPTVLRWVFWANSSSMMPSPDNINRSCDPIDKMVDGIRCYCANGHKGNPYIPYGCNKVISECEKCKRGICMQANKSAESDLSWFCDHDDADWSMVIFAAIIAAIVLGSLTFLKLAWYGNLYAFIKIRKLIKQKEKYFEQNGGLLLKQQLALYGGAESTRIFKAIELKTATKNYRNTNILGKGGFGTVYKGVLPNQKVVAIKKSMKSSESQVEQFINEMVILTQVNHRNVVKLLGCCLETEVPLLVYEFVSKGNLSDHIHEKDDVSWLSWKNCLRIATEIANAIAYLHSAASIPIIHRDIKSSNILLDENLTAKIADFGASRLVPIDQSQVTTLVQGTFGYLDPEYFQTNHLNEKSDVYSFGVVLLELLTRRKPLLWQSEGEDVNLVTYFLLAVKNNRLLDIVEPRLIEEATQEQLNTIAKLAEQCLHVKGEDRPTMKEVAKELEGLKKHVKHPRPELAYEENPVFKNELRGLNVISCRSGCEASRQYTMEQDVIVEMSSPR